MEQLVKVKRCAEGEKLYQEIGTALETHSPSQIFGAVKEYFMHKNGLMTKLGNVISTGCKQCRFVGKDG